MAAIDNLNESVNNLKARTGDVVTKIDELKAKVQELNDALANAGNVDPAIQAAADEINAVIATLGVAVNPPAPTPDPTPAPDQPNP